MILTGISNRKKPELEFRWKIPRIHHTV